MFKRSMWQDKKFWVGSKQALYSSLPVPSTIHLLFFYHVVYYSLSLSLIFYRTAYDVSLNDDSWPQEAFQLISGTTSKIVEKLDPLVTTLTSYLCFLTPIFALWQSFLPLVLSVVLLLPTTSSWRPKCRASFRALLPLSHTVFPQRPHFRYIKIFILTLQVLMQFDACHMLCFTS